MFVMRVSLNIDCVVGLTDLSVIIFDQVTELIKLMRLYKCVDSVQLHAMYTNVCTIPTDPLVLEKASHYLKYVDIRCEILLPRLDPQSESL